MAMTAYQAAVREGRKEGALETQRKYILKAIQTRFQTVPSELSERIETVKSMARLERIFEQCLRVDSPDEIEI